jgi:hypothetical protein
MKLDVAVNDAVLTNVGATGEFKIRNSAKAFKILSDGLYSNKIRAIIRELSCNAVDSHVAAGKSDVPFEVHLPSILEPWFSVKDFGTGLSGDQVMNIYTTYFESTKSNSNDFIGALGLGSKSPFSYTENFTVTAIKDGVKRIYSAYINDNGVPSVAEMAEEETTEANGVEVKFSVTDRSDYNSFRHEAAHVFKWFKKLPTITGDHKLSLEAINYKDKDIAPGVHLLQNGGHGSYAVMGNIAYPLGKVPEPSKHFGNLAHLLENPLVFEFNIGEIDFAASREELSYVPLTLKSIKDKLTALNDNLAKHVALEADKITCEWTKALHLKEKARTRMYTAAVEKYVKDTKFTLVDASVYGGTKTFSYDSKELEKRGLAVQMLRSYGGTCSNISLTHDWRAGKYSWPIEIDKNVVFVLNDLKTGCATRVRYHFNKQAGHRTIHCLSHSDPDLAVRQVAYDKILKELHNPPVVVKASTLDKPEKKKPTSTQGILYLYCSGNAGTPGGYSWTPESNAIDPKQKYYYVCLDNYSPMDPQGNSFDAHELQSLLASSKIPSLEKVVIYGVRKSRIKEISELKNWVWVGDFVKEEIAKIDDKTILPLVAVDMFDNYYTKSYTNKDAARRLTDPKSQYKIFAEKYGKLINNRVNVASLVQLCQNYGKTVKVDDIKKEVEKDKTELIKTYPLLKYLNQADGSEIADYVKLVDKSV